MKIVSNPDDTASLSPVQTAPTSTRSVAHLARAIAFSGVVGLFACHDATAPEADKQVDLAGPSLNVGQSTPLGGLGSTLVDATSWVLPSIDDADKRSEMQSTLDSLASNLVIGAWDAARADVTKAQAIRTSLDVVDQVEIGPIEVSLDATDAELKAIGK